MLAPISSLTVFAAEVSHEFVPADDWRTIIAVPAGIIFFFGSVYLLLRSNLGTRRAYLVMGSSFFGFMVILSLFWAFGAPGTPMATGPQNLPGQALNYYQPQWFPFAPDSELASDEYPLVMSFPEGFEEVDAEEDAELVDLTQVLPDELFAFFNEERGGLIGPLLDGWEPTGDPMVATAPDGTLVGAVTFAPPPEQAGGDDATDPATDPEAIEGETDQAPTDTEPVEETFPGGADEAAEGDVAAEAEAEGEAAPDVETGGEATVDAQPETYTAFAFYDAGFILLPSFIMLGLSLAGFVLHLLLLGWDENRQKEEEQALEEGTQERPERVPARA